MTEASPRAIPSQTPLSLVSAGTVVTSDPAGVFEEGTFHGVYHHDRRCLARYRLTIDGVEPNVLRAARRGAAGLDTAMATSFDAHGDARGVLLRHREVRGDVRDRYTLHRLAPGPPMEILIELGTDRADLLAVKAAEPGEEVAELTPAGSGRLVAAGSEGGEAIAPGSPLVEVTLHGPQVQTSAGRFRMLVDPGVGERITWEVVISVGGRTSATAREDPDGAAGSKLVVRSGDHRWEPAVTGTVEDLTALRIEAAGERFTAAGAPWFMALFGRDALLTAYSALPLGTGPVLDILEALARRQGRRHDPRTLEQPGRILHELRTGASGVFGLEPGEAYYGTADATPLFVLVLAEAARWGADPARVGALLPAARAAVAWCVEHGDVDGDGYVEAVPHEGGIENQGWKDSGDSMVHADGSFAVGPIALVEVQAYVYGALLGLADLERAGGDEVAADRLHRQAAGLKERFLRDFWSDRLGGLVLGLDRDKRPLEVATSNMGHALWTGILPAERAEQVARRVTSDDLFASWGIRTLGAGERAYSPLAYHRGAIWPHDTAIIAAGLARVGAREAFRAVTSELLDLAERFDHRLPELLGGTSRQELPVPVPYPVACSPQAWSAAAPLLLLRAMLGLQPDLPRGVVRLAPSLPVGQHLTVEGLHLGEREVAITVGSAGVEVAGIEGLDLVLDQDDG
ncbi:MAG: MGH1-like glycoside hydrolase domain-containing protein [Nitriliruptoraceae bacterium]